MRAIPFDGTGLPDAPTSCPCGGGPDQGGGFGGGGGAGGGGGGPSCPPPGQGRPCMGGGGGGGMSDYWTPKNGDGSGDGGSCNPLADGASCVNEDYQPMPDPGNPFAAPLFPLGGSLAYPACTEPEE